MSQHSGLCQPLLALLFLNSIPLSAQQLMTTPIKTASGVDFTPQLDFEMRHDDNIANTAANEQSSWVSILTPELSAQLLSGPNQYRALVKLVSGSYLSSKDDNYLDWQAQTSALLELSSRHRFDISASYAGAHEARGTGITEGRGNQLTEPAELRNFRLNGAYEYGTRSGRAQWRLFAGYYDKQYQSYEDLTQFRNYDSTKVGTELFYNTGASTHLLAEVNQVYTRYDLTDVTGSRDSDTTNYRIGGRWQPSELTAAELRVGYQNRQFDNPLRQDFSGVAWDMKLQWAPLSYSRFNLSTGRQSKEPDTQGDFVKETHYSLFWTHNWQPLFSTRAGIKRVEDEYTGFDRSDTLMRYQLSAHYSVMPQLLLGAGVVLHRNDSTQDNIRFDKNEVFVNLQLAL
ncbi:MAG: hypothetical protein CL577_04195 [Alteromonadaceae bacterium]|nr:hypothetical protein [Alteromonadaceae bacterium]